MPAGAPIAPDEWLSQYGDRDYFRRRPRGGQVAVSLTRGRLTPRQAHEVVVGDRGKYMVGSHGVRHVKAEQLLARRFAVRHTPSQSNPNHVSIECEGEWDEDKCEAFEGAFLEPVFEEVNDD